MYLEIYRYIFTKIYMYTFKKLENKRKNRKQIRKKEGERSSFIYIYEELQSKREEEERRKEEENGKRESRIEEDREQDK